MATVRSLLAVLLVVLPLLHGMAAAEEDYYDILDLKEKEEASEKDIKKQFRTLSKKYHPDLNPTEEAKEKYVKIQRAHEVLSDRKKRKVYDMKGEEGLKQLETMATNPNSADPFMQMFGMGGDRNKGQNMRMQMDIPLADFYNGNAHKITITKQKLCKACKGTGAASKEDLVSCKACGGKGVVLQRVQLAPGFVQQVQNPCNHCQGTGKSIKKKCNKCKGAKVFRGKHQLTVDIEQGMPEEHTITFEMEGDQSPDVLPGDVLMTVRSQKHDIFTRKGNDLAMTLNLSLHDALLGFATSFPHLDKHVVDVEEDGVVQWGQKRVIKGEGMPIHNVPSEKGDLTITYNINLPTKLTKDQARRVRDLFPE